MLHINMMFGGGHRTLYTLQMYLNIAGSEEFLLGIDLFDADLSEKGHTRESTHFVDTKVSGSWLEAAKFH